MVFRVEVCAKDAIPKGLGRARPFEASFVPQGKQGKRAVPLPG
jgi:hypothetical protein